MFYVILKKNDFIYNFGGMNGKTERKKTGKSAKKNFATT